jgi:hypothetical protein
VKNRNVKSKTPIHGGGIMEIHKYAILKICLLQAKRSALRVALRNITLEELSRRRMPDDNKTYEVA